MTYSGVETFIEHDHGLINTIRLDTGLTPLHVAAQLNRVDQVNYLAAIVSTLYIQWNLININTVKVKYHK